MTLDVLSAGTAIVDDKFKPTKEFMIKWAQLAQTLGTIPALSTAAQVSAIIDLLGSGHNDLLVRGTTEWGVLGPGTTGELLTMTSGGPAWVAPAAETLAGLTDVAITSPTNGQVLTYDTSLTKWKNAAGGGGGGGITPPAIVQEKAACGTIAGVTMTTAPTAGNLLIALVGAPAFLPSPGAGWTQIAVNTSGLDWGLLYYKIAGVGESATQNPMAATQSHAMVAIYELSTANVLFLTLPALYGIPNDQSSPVPITNPMPANAGDLVLVAFEGTTFGAPTFSVGTVDDTQGDGTRSISCGHYAPTPAAMVAITATFGGSGVSKAMSIVLTGAT